MNDQRQVAGCPHLELAVGWAMHSLEPAEESLVAAHLPDCADCREAIAQTEEIGAMLGLSVPEMVPSAELEQRILSVTGTPLATPVVPLASPAPPTPPAGRLAAFPGSRFGQLAAAAVVILVAGAVGLGIRVAQLNGQLDDAHRQVTAISEAMQRAADPGAIRVPLVGADGHPVGMVLASQSQVAMVPTQLPGNQVADQTYVLWGLAGSTPIPLAAFDVTGQAPGLHAVTAAAQLPKFTGYAISLEPGRRAPAVPTDIVATGKVVR